jgi:SpoVK/Ycf46/Vps4 family AAA+-type ATPase
MTLLFSGPPGVGKTACAEGLAAELGLSILVADYGQVENCFVGETEKNISRLFREAASHRALLFLDEADAVLANRDRAFRNWEVRAVNVLLQQIERYEGVCILATNRLEDLDRALERRVSIKIRFERPDTEQRRRIWEILVPPSLPLADDVDLDSLAEYDLSGGEIKNALLNAARAALTRGPHAKVTGQDLRRSARAELDGKWGGSAGEPIGYGRSGAL